MNTDMMGDDTPIDAAIDATPYEPPAGFTKLIGGTWNLAPGQTDTYVCVRFTVPNETYITNIQAQAPTGTHHTVLSISDGSTAGPDGKYNCAVNELGMVMLYASGVGTAPLDFPTDVSVKIAAGTQVHLNLHLFNASDNALSGESGIWIKSQPTPTPTLAEMVFAGKIIFQLASNNQNTDIVGGCNNTRNFSLFAVWPHMHQLANHSKFEIIRGQNPPMVIHDMPYSFSEQNYYKQTPPIQVMNGDQIRVTCTYLNNTGQIVRFGDSSNEEMCFVGMYRYPAANAGLSECSDVPNF